MDREQMLRCLEQVDAYRASGLKGKQWAQANGVPLLSLQSWCAHAERWRARLGGVAAAAPACAPTRASGFVAARVAPAAARSPESPSVRLEMGAGGGSVALHWPLTHSRELAAWLREFTR